MEIRLAIMKGAAELVGKEPGADPDNLTSREKTTLIKDISVYFVKSVFRV